MRQLRNATNNIDSAVRMIHQQAFALPEDTHHFFQFGHHEALTTETLINPCDPLAWPINLDATLFETLKLHHIPNLNLACYKPDTALGFKKPSMKPVLDKLYDDSYKLVDHDALPWIVAQAIMVADLLHQQNLPCSILAAERCYVTDDHELVIITLGQNLSAEQPSDPIHHFLLFFLQLCGWQALISHETFKKLQTQHQSGMTIRMLSDMARAHRLPCGHITLTDLILKAFERRQHFGAYLANASKWPLLNMPAAETFTHIKQHFWPKKVPWVSHALAYPHANFGPKHAPHARHILTLLLHIKNHLNATKPNHRLMQILDTHFATKPFDTVSLFHILSVRQHDIHHLDVKQSLRSILAILKQHTHFNRIDAQSMCNIQHHGRAIQHHLAQQMLEVANHLAVLQVLSLELDTHDAKDCALCSHIETLSMIMHDMLLSFKNQLTQQHGNQLTQAFLQDPSLQAAQLRSLIEDQESNSTMMIQTALCKKQVIPKPHPAIKHLYEHACKQDIDANALLEYALASLALDDATDVVSHGPQLQALFIMTLKHAKQHQASHGGHLQHKTSIIYLKEALMMLENIKHTERQKRKQNTRLAASSKRKRLIPMLCVGGGMLALSFGLTGAMFALPMEELMVFNTFLMGEELIALLMTSGSGIIGLWKYQQKHETKQITSCTEASHPDAYDAPASSETPKHMNTQALIQKISHSLKDIQIERDPLIA